MPAKVRTGELMPSAPMRRRAAICLGLEVSVVPEDFREMIGHVDRLSPSGSSMPFPMLATLVLESRQSSASSSSRRLSSALERLAFSTIVAMVRSGAL